jgi:adenosylcobinamide-GDP ribazoletransferase
VETGRLAQASAMRHHIGRLGLAFSFLTILPVPMQVSLRSHASGELGRAALWFPLVGLVIGGLLWGVHHLTLLWFTPLLAAITVVACWAILTGALHLDGLADCCDGLLPPVAQARRLEIMRDPHVGAFGAVGLVLFLLAKVGAVAALATPLPALLLAPVWARWMLLWATRQPGHSTVRPGGMGAAFGDTLTLATIAGAGIVPILLLFYPTFSARHFAAAAAALVTVIAIVHFARTRVGGVTGDVLGTVVECCELVILLAFAAGTTV